MALRRETWSNSDCNSCNRVCDSFSAVSDRVARVTSRATFDAPTSRPETSKIGDTDKEMFTIEPSARRRKVS